MDTAKGVAARVITTPSECAMGGLEKDQNAWLAHSNGLATQLEAITTSLKCSTSTADAAQNILGPRPMASFGEVSRMMNTRSTQQISQAFHGRKLRPHGSKSKGKGKGEGYAKKKEKREDKGGEVDSYWTLSDKYNKLSYA